MQVLYDLIYLSFIVKYNFFLILNLYFKKERKKRIKPDTDSIICVNKSFVLTYLSHYVFKC